jgi:hypothetical protein
MNILKKSWWILVLLIFSCFVSFVWFHDGIAKATGESGLLFVALKKYLILTKDTWIDTTVGETEFSFNGAFPILLVFQIISKFVTGGFIQALFFALSIIFGSIGTGLIAKYFYPKIKGKYLLFISLAYIFNPYSIYFVWNRFLYNQIFSYGVIPLLTYLLLLYLKRGTRKILLGFFLLSFICSFAFTGIAFLLTYAVTAIIFTVGCWFLNKNKKEIFIRGFVIAVVFIFSQIFWLLPFYSGNRLSVGYSSSFFSEEGNLKTTIDLSSYYGSIFNKIQQIRADISQLAYEGIPLGSFYSTSFQHYLSFIPLILLAISILLLILLKIRYSIFLIISFAILALLINGTSPPLGLLYLQIYKLNPVVQILRNPYEKMGGIFYIIVFIIWGVGLWSLELRKSKYLANILLALSFAWWILTIWPIFTGVVFTYKYAVSKDPEIGFRVKVPAYYTDVNNYLNETLYQSRAIALPITGEGITQTWEYGYDGVESYNALFDKPFISLDTTSGKLPEIAKSIRESDISGIISMAGILNVSDIVVRRDLVPPVDSPPPQTLLAELENKLEGKIFADGVLKVFKVPENVQIPRIFPLTNVYETNKPTFDKINISNNKIGIYAPQVNFQSAGNIIYPKAAFEEISTGSTPNENEFLSQLPYVRYQRDSFLYRFVRIKEKLHRFFNPQEKRSFQITLSLKRLVEIKYLLGKNNLRELNNSITDYKKTIEPLIQEASLRLENNGSELEFWNNIFRVHDYVLNSFLNKASSKERPILDDLYKYLSGRLIESGVYPRYKNEFMQNDSYFVKRIIFQVPSNGSYELNFGNISASENLYGNFIQVDDRQELLTDQINQIEKDESIVAAMNKGIHELRIPIKKQLIDINSTEISLESNNDQSTVSSKTWSVETPDYTGEFILNFEYKLIEGEGPNITILQENNRSKPIAPVSEINYNPGNDNSGWREKSVVFPLYFSAQKLEITLSAKPSNNCQIQNRLDSKCLSQAFSKLYDKNSNFLLRNIKAYIKPNVDLQFVSSEEGNLQGNLPGIIWEKVNPAIYKVKVSDVQKPFVLAFLNQYHSGWAMYEIPKLGFSDNNLKNWEKFNVIEKLSQLGTFDGVKLALETLFASSIQEKNHIIVAGYANGWIVDKGSSYLIIFLPQRMLYLGWGVTILAMIILILINVKSVGLKRTRIDEKN